MRRNASSRVGQTAAFEDARAVATCEDSNGATLLAVADLGKHQVRLLGLRGLSVVSTRVLGTGVPGHVSGAINSASFFFSASCSAVSGGSAGAIDETGSMEEAPQHQRIAM